LAKAAHEGEHEQEGPDGDGDARDDPAGGRTPSCHLAAVGSTNTMVGAVPGTAPSAPEAEESRGRGKGSPAGRYLPWVKLVASC
jgi:hypothetical protein